MTPEPREVLAPCPFCNGTATVIGVYAPTVQCDRCECEMSSPQRWNARPPSRLREVARRVAAEMKAATDGADDETVERWADELESAAGGGNDG